MKYMYVTAQHLRMFIPVLCKYSKKYHDFPHAK